MGSAKTGSWAAGNAAAKRASTEQPVRCVSWAAMDPPVPEVRSAESRVGALGKGSRLGTTPCTQSKVTPVLRCPTSSM